MPRARLFLFAALVPAAALTATARTAAETTVGSALNSRADFSISCPASGGCTLLGGATVPKAGVIVRWRLRAATRGSVRLRILHEAPGGLVAVASGPAQRLDRRHAPGRDVSYAFTARLPVEQGDALALDAGRGAVAVLHRRARGTAVRLFTPAVPDGGPAGAAEVVDGAELLLSADVEPDADGDGFGDETQDNCPSIANDQTSNPCPSTAATPTPTGNDDTDTKPPRTTGWRRHKHTRHAFAR